MDRGLTVLNAVGDRAVDVAVRVSDLAREDTTKSIAAAAAFVVVFGAMAAATAVIGKEYGQNEANNKQPKG